MEQPSQEYTELTPGQIMEHECAWARSFVSQADLGVFALKNLIKTSDLAPDSFRLKALKQVLAEMRRSQASKLKDRKLNQCGLKLAEKTGLDRVE